MFNNQDFMELGWRNDVGSFAVKDHDVGEMARSEEDRLIHGLKWSYDNYFDHDQKDNHLQIVPEIQKVEEEVPKTDLLVVVPDEHSETGDHHDHISDNRYYLRNKHEKPKRRRIQVFSDEESDGFTREVPSVTRKGSKRRRSEEMCNKMRTLQQLVPDCHKTDKVSVLDDAIEYMKSLQLQFKVMSMMGMNPYFPPAILDFGMNNHQLTAMAVARQNVANQMMSSQLIPASNWPLPPFTNFSFPHSPNQPLFLTTTPPASSHQCLHGLVPCFPSFLDFSSHAMRRL
ncbi:unnamed protein product [Arabidopsis halleri]